MFKAFMMPALAAGTLVAACGSASADTIDFSGAVQGFQGSTSVTIDGVEFTSGGTDLFVDTPGAPGLFPGSGGICAVDGATCAADLTIDFGGDIENFVFEVGGFSDGDAVNVFTEDDGVGTGAFAITSNGTFDLTAFGSFDTILFEDVSTLDGIAYGRFEFDRVAAVPVPAGGMLLLGALAALALRRRAI